MHNSYIYNLHLTTCCFPELAAGPSWTCDVTPSVLTHIVASRIFHSWLLRHLLPGLVVGAVASLSTPPP